MTAIAPADLPVPRLLVWRHGRTGWNATGRFQGQLDPPLDDEGRRQAGRAAAVIAAALQAGDTLVVSSDLIRATETARALTDLWRVPLRLDPRLREHGLGCWEGLTRDEVAERYPEQYADWIAGRPVRGRGGEEPSAVARRALAAVADLPPAAAAVVVTHGGTSSRLIESILGLYPEHRRVFGHLGNCCWSDLRCQSGQWQLLRHNMSVTQVPEGARVGGPATGAAMPAEVAEPAAIDASPDADRETGDADAVG